MKAAESKERTTDEAQIRASIEDWGEGLRNKDAERCASHYTDDVVQFNLAPPLEYRGKETVRNNLAEWFKSFDGPIEFDQSGLNITLGGETAFARSLNHIRGSENGQDRKSTRLNSSHLVISYAVFCLKKKKEQDNTDH